MESQEIPLNKATSEFDAVWEDMTNCATMEGFFHEYFRNEDVNTALQYFLNHAKDIPSDVLENIPGSEETFLLLKKHDIPYAIASNSPQEVLDAMVKIRFPEKEDRPIAIGLSKDRPKKPDTPIVKEALKQLRANYSDRTLKEKNILLVGDNHRSDVLAANTLGMRPILFSDTEKHNFEDIPPHVASIENYPKEVGYVRNHDDLQQYITHQLEIDNTTLQASQPPQQRR